MLQVKCNTLSSNTVEMRDKYPITHETAQGSFLGPLLFNIFCNDIYKNVQYCILILFTDDTILYASHQNTKYLNFMLQEDIKHLNLWFKIDQLLLNLQKTSAMVFLPKQTPNTDSTVKLKLDDIILPTVNQTKFLAVIIDSQMDWKEHINNILRKVSINKDLIGKSCNLMNTFAKCKIYYAHIYSHLSYTNTVWSDHTTHKPKRQLERKSKIIAFKQ